MKKFRKNFGTIEIFDFDVPTAKQYNPKLKYLEVEEKFYRIFLNQFKEFEVEEKALLFPKPQKSVIFGS